jgi:protein-S-isoprenylcysteine O-methyltransferase Ste14
MARSRPVGDGLVIIRAGTAWLANAAFVAVLQLRFIRHEEELMERCFGDAYRAYRARVRRWLWYRPRP